MRWLLFFCSVVAAYAHCPACQTTGPASPAEQSAWLQALQADRNSTLKRINFTGGVFGVPELKWTQTAYIQPQMHPYDRYFYDNQLGKYTVQRYLDDLKARYGGIDAALIWPTYTNIGIDDRDQFDFFRSMPGGLQGVAEFTRELKQRGVRVLWPYNPWDLGTRQEPNGFIPNHYEAFLGANAYTGHGATSMDSQPVADLTEEECVARCDADPSCDCVVFDPAYNNGQCWKNRDCDPAGFDYNTELTLWMKKKGYSEFAGKNCFSGYGGEDIDTDATAATNVTADQCKERCDRDSSCGCVAYSPSAKTCWKRMNCFPGQFQHDSSYTVYFNGSRALNPGRNDAETFALLLKQTGGDGFNGDTMNYIPKPFWNAAVKHGYPLAFEPESGGSDESLNWDTMGWGYWDYPHVPVVDRLKFLSHGKWMTNVCDRWKKNKTENLQAAWFNGDGYESWENVWGIWNGIVPRDGEALRRVATMLRYLGKEGYLQSPHWEPHTTEVLQESVYASKWPLPEKQATLWTIVNRAGRNLSGPQLKVDAGGSSSLYDCYHGVELKANQAGQAEFFLEAGGYGCLLQTSTPAAGPLSNFLDTMKTMTMRALASFSAEWNYLLQTMVPIAFTAPATSAPAGMVYVPHAHSYVFSVQGVEIEGNDGTGVDVQFPWESFPSRHHQSTLEVGPFYMDKFPVTCGNYSHYLQATGFQPKDAYNWLKNWNGSRTCPAKLVDRPVTYVSLNEARAYCKWAGARLPHSWEWQYAAQGTDGRKFPWGNTQDQTRYPVLNRGSKNPGPEPVSSHSPAGDSPFGVADLVGNVWQYTDEFQDDHTRAVLLRGSANYRPIDPSAGGGAGWYFPQAMQLDQHNKYFLMDDRYERAGTIGFRCVVDAAKEQEAGTLLV